MRISWRASVLLLGALSAVRCTCDSDAPSPAPEPDTHVADFTPDADGCVEGVTSLDPGVHAGVSLAHNYQHGGRRGYGSATSAQTLEELRALGVRWVSLTPFGFMDSLEATEVRMASGHPAAENDARMEAEIRAARGRGLRVFLKPHVWIARGAWRGHLRPTDWAAWFESYLAFIVHYADMAQRLDVELLAIGVEFPVEGHEGAWRDVIAAVRDAYEGELTFAANWDAADAVPFWDALEYVGVQLYPPLADEIGASEASMRRALDRHLDGLEALGDRVDRPVLLTEVGYKSIVGAEVHPHTWPERHGDPTPSEPAQAQAYGRLFDALHARPRIRGVYLWKWFTDPDTDEEAADGFSPRGKLAEHVLRSAYLQRCASR